MTERSTAPAPQPDAQTRIVRVSEATIGAFWRAEVERIFFASSATQAFPDAQTRDRFRHLWLNTYLDGDPQETHLALAPEGAVVSLAPEGSGISQSREGAVVGYLVGALADPARDPRFTDLAYFAHLRDLTATYPAHLHVNIDPQWRGRGVGAALVAAFAEHAARCGASGMHIVTGRGQRNIGFYLANGFDLLREADLGGDKVVVMMGRRLG